MKDINSVEEFDAEAQSEGLTVAKFWAAWCGPCRSFAPVVEEVAEQVGPLATFVNVNIEDVPDLASRYQIRSIPAMVFIKDGVLVETHVGSIPASEIRAKVDEHK